LYPSLVQGAFEYVSFIIYLYDLVHKYLTWCALWWCKTLKLHSWKFLHHGRSKSAVHVKTNFSFHFKGYNLTIRAINFFETFCTCSSGSLVQDPTVKIPKIELFFSILAYWARNGWFEHFFEKNDLRPSRVNFFEKLVFWTMSKIAEFSPKIGGILGINQKYILVVTTNYTKL
jgi:hypothetical protein